jgi:hypothetical protein
VTTSHAAVALAVLAALGGCAIEDADLQETPAIVEFTLAPEVDETSVFEVTVAGTIEFGVLAAEPAVLDLQVEGASVYRETFDVSTSTSATFEVALPLGRVGPNEIIGVVSFAGQARAAEASVAVALAAPTITLPTWDQAYVPLESLTLTGDVEVAPAAGYAVDEVAYKVDDGPWLAATPTEDGAYAIEVRDPDIGDSDLDVRVTTSTAGHVQETHAFDRLHVDPIFDCADHGAMRPDNALVRQVGTENRVMVGYFGDPGHAVSFTLTGTGIENIGTLTVASATLTNGRFAVTTQYLVDDFRCPDSPCDFDVDLTAMVDGVELCSEVDFGTVTDF